MPFVQKMPVSGLLIDENDYPRAVLLEAAVRFIEESLLAEEVVPRR